MSLKNISFLSLSFILIFACSSCKQDKSQANPPQQSDVSTNPVVGNTKTESKGLPDPCASVQKEDIAKLLSKTVDKITYKSGSAASSTTRSCFYRWTDSAVPNSAILLQALGNPVPDEFSGWAAAFIENKKSNGERLLSDPDTPIKYVTLKGLGDHSCYNLQESKCYMRAGDVVFLVATNGIEDDNLKMDIFKTLGSKILDANQ